MTQSPTSQICSSATASTVLTRKKHEGSHGQRRKNERAIRRMEGPVVGVRICLLMRREWSNREVHGQALSRGGASRGVTKGCYGALLVAPSFAPLLVLPLRFLVPSRLLAARLFTDCFLCHAFGLDVFSLLALAPATCFDSARCPSRPGFASEQAGIMLAPCVLPVRTQES